tara:strand:- start:1720 stop:2487 length:768 start_codon:yes stop_codon:yes gene_type:complete
MENGLNKDELKKFLDEKYQEYNNINFIEDDPIQIPHLFTNEKDIEIAGFLTSIISWGNRKSIINSGKKMMNLMDYSPYDFIINSNDSEIKKLNFIHRTFNSTDLQFFIMSLKNIYIKYGNLEDLFLEDKSNFMFHGITKFREIFFSTDHEKRSQKHISNPLKNSCCKRINMFLRWMVRDDKNVDFGIWKKIKKSKLSCPLDVHSGRVARKLGLIKRKQNDLKSLIELDQNLRLFDNEDPVKYDFSLFGLGMYEGF